MNVKEFTNYVMISQTKITKDGTRILVIYDMDDLDMNEMADIPEDPEVSEYISHWDSVEFKGKLK